MLNNTEQSRIESLIEKLGEKNGMIREAARKELVAIGKKSKDYLLQLMDNPKHILRWEAMKTLKEIKAPSLIPIFIEKLEDDESDIRWIAAEGLITQGKESIVPLLKVLLDKSDSVFILTGSHHVFRELLKENKIAESSPVANLLPLLKITSLTESLEIAVHEILSHQSL